jgi:hypothetical protein
MVSIPHVAHAWFRGENVYIPLQLLLIEVIVEMEAWEELQINYWELQM